jgi:hypothetical protein
VIWHGSVLSLQFGSNVIAYACQLNKVGDTGNLYEHNSPFRTNTALCFIIALALLQVLFTVAEVRHSFVMLSPLMLKSDAQLLIVPVQLQLVVFVID